MTAFPYFNVPILFILMEHKISRLSSFSALPPIITQTINVKYESGVEKKYHSGTPVSIILEPALKKAQYPAVGAYVNNEIMGFACLM